MRGDNTIGLTDSDIEDIQLQLSRPGHDDLAHGRLATNWISERHARDNARRAFAGEPLLSEPDFFRLYVTVLAPAARARMNQLGQDPWKLPMREGGYSEEEIQTGLDARALGLIEQAWLQTAAGRAHQEAVEARRRDKFARLRLAYPEGEVLPALPLSKGHEPTTASEPAQAEPPVPPGKMAPANGTMQSSARQATLKAMAIEARAEIKRTGRSFVSKRALAQYLWDRATERGDMWLPGKLRTLENALDKLWDELKPE